MRTTKLFGGAPIAAGWSMESLMTPMLTSFSYQGQHFLICIRLILIDMYVSRYGSWSTAKTDRSGYPFLQNFLHDQFRYPKAGTTNPTVALMAANVGSKTRPLVQYPLSPPSSLHGTPAHFTSVTWADHSTVAVNWMNRVQNLSAVALCPLHDPASQCREVLVLPERDGWVDYKFKPVFQPSQGDGKFLAILPAAALRYRPRQLFLIDTAAGSRSLLTRHVYKSLLLVILRQFNFVLICIYHSDQNYTQGGGDRGDRGGEVDR